jgi:hypothetical protein
MATGEYKLRVTVDGAEAAKGQLTGLGKSVSGVGSQIKSMMGQFIGIYAVVNSVKAISSAIIEQEDAVAGLNASLRMTETYSAEFSQSLQDNASALQAMTVYGDEAIMTGTALMQNIGHLAQDQLPAAQKAALGLAAAYNMDLQTAFQMVGKAAAGNTATLARYGIVLEEGLSAQEKFSKILEIGAQSFGLAEAAAKTTGGQLKQFQNAWGDMLETLGALLAPIMTGLVSVLKPMVEWFGKLNGTIKAVLVLVPLLVVGWKALAASTIATTIATGGFTAAMTTAIVAVKAFLASIGPVGWAIIGVGTALAANSILMDKNKKGMDAVATAADEMKNSMDGVRKSADLEAETFKALSEKLLEMKKAGDASKGTKREMKTLINALNRDYGQYLGNLDLERASYDQIASAATKAANAIASKKLAEGYGNLAAEQAKKVAELRLQYDKLYSETITQNYFDTLRGQEGGGQGGGADFGDALVKRNNKNLAAVKANLDAAEAELKRIVKAYTDAMTAADLFAEGDETPGAAGSGIGAIGERVMSAYEKQIALAREMVANVKLLGLTEQQYTDQRNILLEDSLAQYQKYGMAEEQINAIRTRSQALFVEEYKELMSQMPDNLAAYYEEMKFLDADYYDWRKEQIINYVEALGLSAEQQVLLMGKMFKDLDKEQKEFLDSTKATGIAWEDHVNAVLETYMELGATQAEYEKWRTLQIENEIRALADLGVDSELLNVLLRQRLDLLGQEYEAYQKLRDEAAMDAWIEQHELQYDLLSNTVDIVTEGFATMIEEGKSFNETMKDIWKDWVAMAIQEVQRLIAKLITAFIIKKLIQAADIATGGVGGIASLGGEAASDTFIDTAIGGWTRNINTGGGIGITTTGGQSATLNQVVLELQQLRRDVYQAQPNSVKMDFKRGELSYAVDNDKRYRVAMA